MSEPTLFDPIVPPDPVGSLARVPHFAEQFRAGRLSGEAAVSAMAAEVAAYVEQQRRTMAAHDAEITGDREGQVRADARDTSAKAARDIAPRTGTQRAAVLIDIVEHDGASDFEIAARLGMLENSVRPRRHELSEGGYITASGRIREHRGSSWAIWAATPSGRSWYVRNTMGGAA